MRQSISAAMTVMLAIILLLSALSATAPSVKAVLPNDPGFRGCVIATSNGALPDTDCDRTPDPYDNCPYVANPDQVDVDNNGIGDACDLVIDQIKIDPETPMQGRSMMATISVFNARAYAMRNLNVKLEVPKLGLEGSEQISVLQSGERLSRDIVVRIPVCAPIKLTDIVAVVEYPYAPGQQEVFSQALKVPIVQGDSCTTGPVDDKTVVNVLEIQDVDPINGALYPFTIHNNQAESRAYVLSVTGEEDWGYTEINPGTVIVVPPGESREGAIQAYAYRGVSGDKSMVLTVQAKDDMKQIMLKANVLESKSTNAVPPLQLLLGILGFVGILVLIAIVFLFAKKKQKK